VLEADRMAHFVYKRAAFEAIGVIGHLDVLLAPGDTDAVDQPQDPSLVLSTANLT